MIAQEATQRARIEKWYVTATFSHVIKIKRLLKPFKGGIFGGVGGKFTGFEGGTENA